MRIDQIRTPDGTASSDCVAVLELTQRVTCAASSGNGRDGAGLQSSDAGGQNALRSKDDREQ